MSSPTLNNGYYNGFIFEAKEAAVNILSQFIDNDNKGSDCLYDELKTFVYGVDVLETSYMPSPQNGLVNCLTLAQANELVNILEETMNSDNIIPSGVTGGAVLSSSASRLTTDQYDPIIDDDGNYFIA